MSTKNSKGTIFYGMHMYPGVAEYKEHGEDFRVFLNENTIRSMGPSFAGRPVFVMHVDDVSEDVDKLRGEADGWVIESFFNEADGKHWAKFIVCSEKGEKAIRKGYRLSNCYAPKSFGNGGEWNGVSYAKEIKGGEYEHLAIVPNPRYEESVIMTPSEFKAYNEKQKIELAKLTNDKGDSGMKFFKRAKVENSADFENVIVVLPKSNREVSITTLVNEADAAEELKGKPQAADDAHIVKVGDEEMTVAELRNSFLENAKGKDCDDKVENKEDDEDKMENEDDDDKVENEDEDDDMKAKAKAKEDAKDKKENKKKKNDDGDLEARRKAKEKADRVRNARPTDDEADAPRYNPMGAVERGKSRYG